MLLSSITVILFQNCSGHDFIENNSSKLVTGEEAEVINVYDVSQVISERSYNNMPNGLLTNYAPAVVWDGANTHMYTCSNNSSPGFFKDVIGYFINDQYIGQVLSHTGIFADWDGQHACDPSILKTSMTVDNVKYDYLMAYLGEDFNDINGDGQHTCDISLCEHNMHNQIGIAVSKSLLGPWKKIPGPLIPFSDKRFWGVGQPSLLPTEDGHVIIIYTRGDQLKTSVYYQKYDLKNFTSLNGPRLLQDSIEIQSQGLTSNNSSPVFLRNADFVLSRDYQTIYMLRGSEEHHVGVQMAKMSYSNFLKGKDYPTSWTQLINFDSTTTPYYKVHNAGFVRTPRGFVVRDDSLSLFLTANPQNPSVNGNPIEWDYKIFNYNYKF